MPVGIAWNAGAVRARLLSRRRLGREGGRELASQESLDAAVRRLRGGPYGHDVEGGMGLASAQWAVAATPLWHLRVLGGWLPPAGGELVRTLVGWWEVLNVENLVAELSGGSASPSYELGSLDTSWDRVRTADSLQEARKVLAASSWDDPGGDDPAAIVTGIRLSWAGRVNEEVDPLARLAAGWAALVVARDLFLGRAARRQADFPRLRILGQDWRTAGDLAELSQRLPRDASWVLEEVTDPEDLWQSEVRWWRTLEDESLERLRRADSGPDAVVGAFGALLADAHRVQGALQLAARGGVDTEVIDELF